MQQQFPILAISFHSIEKVKYHSVFQICSICLKLSFKRLTVSFKRILFVYLLTEKNLWLSKALVSSFKKKSA